MPYNTKQDAINALMGGAGWVSTGEQPNMESVDNPKAGEPYQPAKIPKQNGIEITLRGPNGEVDSVIIKEVGNNPDTKGGVGFDAVRGPLKNVPQAPTPVSQWTPLDDAGQPVAPGAKPSILQDPKTGVVLKVDPTVKTDPSTWTPIYNPNDKTEVIGLWDAANSKMGASVPSAPAGTKDSPPDNWTPVYRTPGDKTSTLVGQWDPVNNLLHAVSQTDDGKTIVETPTGIYSVDRATDKSTLVQSITPNMPPTVFTMGNTAYVFDPKAPAGQQITKGPTGEEPTTVGISTDNEWYIFFKDGKETSRVKNPSFRPQQNAAPPTSLSSPTIPRWNAKTGAWEDVPNTGRLTIGDVTQQMIKDLTGQTVDPNHPMTLEEANTVLTSAISKMTADAQQASTARGAAGDILTANAAGATTGAGLLQQRQQTTQNLIQQGLGVATSTGGRYGNYSGGMLNPVPGLGQALVQGAGAYATELGGGQAVYDTAVRMVQAADPNNSNPDRAAAVGLLRQVMEKYQAATNQEHPAVTATKALQASQTNGGMAAPPVVSPVPAVPQGFNQYGPVMGTPGVGGATPSLIANPYQSTAPTAVVPQTPQQLGFQAPGAIMGIVGPMAMAANR